MVRRVSELLAERATESFLGRTEEIAILLRMLETDGDLAVMHVHGAAGIGKSSLLEVYAAQARAQGATVVRLDCRVIEPTPRGFTHELASAIGHGAEEANEIADRLSQIGGRVVLTLDTYEVLHLLDTWLRLAFIPSLGDNVKVVLAGREPPNPAWNVAPEWQGWFGVLSLGPLNDDEAIDVLMRAGVSEPDSIRINRVARGHPLALKLAASTVAQRPELDLEEVAIPTVLRGLTRLYLADVDDPMTRRGIEASSVVRRTTQSLLGAMLADAVPHDLYERLGALPILEYGRDGLIMHDAVREAVAAALKASDPARYQDYRRSAWRQLRSEASAAAIADLWRYTADMLYIVENPTIREAFFPSGGQHLAVEPALMEDEGPIMAITRRHDGPRAAEVIEDWWERTPHAFHVVRDKDRSVVGFYCMLDSDQIPRASLEYDPIAAAWMAHLDDVPAPERQRVLFLRRWLCKDGGETPSPVQAACWLDIKRVYMELRPNLRRVYVAVRDLPTYAPVAQELGISPIDNAHRKLDGALYHSAVLDLGPGSVDGWLTGLVATELGVEEDGVLDVGARELVVGGHRVGLTKLEFGVMRHLYEREGRAVSRADLVENVWGYDYQGGSNVVDVVVRSLRKKLGESASVVQTVRGVGYRFRGA